MGLRRKPGRGLPRSRRLDPREFAPFRLLDAPSRSGPTASLVRGAGSRESFALEYERDEFLCVEESRSSGEFPEVRGPNRVSDVMRFRLDDVRRYATELVSGLGVAPRRAAVLA